MDASEAEKLTRENEYLKVRIEQLQGEVWDLSGQLARSQQRLERSDLNRLESPPNPLSGGR
jgi:predicted RNase H-like nuclease (RuvC/YqgF family)